MKGTRGTGNFGYDSTYFTSNSTTLNTSSLSDDVNTDAKFGVYNNLQVTKLLAVLRNDTNGLISNQGDISSNSFGGHVWLDALSSASTAQSVLANYTNRNSSGVSTYSNVPVSKYRESSSGGSTLVFSYQTGNALYGNSVSCTSGPKARWGIIWNNEGDWSSCDTMVGIGLAVNSTPYSPGDRMLWDGVRTGGSGSAPNGYGKGETAFQIWGKMADPSLTAPGTPTVATSGSGQVTVSWTAPGGTTPTDYVVQYKLRSDGWGTNPSQSAVVATTSATISGLQNSTLYDFRVVSRTSSNSSLTSSTASHTIQTQTITFGSLSNKTMGSGTFSISATSSSTLTVAFTSATLPVCTVSGTTVTVVSAGLCTINANQSGNSTFAPAAQVQQSFTVSAAVALTTPTSGLNGTFNSAYTLNVIRSGGASPYTFAIASGILPSGLAIETSTGVIRGTPSAASTQTVTVRVTDANGAIATTNAFTLTVSRETLETPTAPTVAASTTSLKRLDVSWSAVSNASSYVVKLYDSTGTGSALATVSVTSGTSRTLTTSEYASFADLTAYTVSVQAIGVSNYQDSLESNKTSARTRGLPQSITVDTSGVVDATGAWIGGTWYTATLGASRVTPTSLQTQMSSANATLQTAGSITVSNAVDSPNASSSLNLNSTGSNVTVNAAISGVSGFTVTCD
jgi:hypothetical protein